MSSMWSRLEVEIDKPLNILVKPNHTGKAQTYIIKVISV